MEEYKDSMVMSISSSDPLSQTFIIEEIGGCFLTSLDLFFSER